ncbi:MAG: hypothetical protein HY550_11265 [Elusimicrobia bacterium]|nr:hypothetical protein [Elusimicrobiota bacterium]
MRSTRQRILAALLLLFAGGGVFSYFKYRQLSGYLVNRIGGLTSVKFGRQVKFKSVSFSPLEGIVITEACVSRRPDFSKGSFFCAAKAVIRPKFSALLRNRLYFSRVTFEKPVLKVRERGGAWDFADLLALLPETNKGLHLTWNAGELVLKDAVVEADLETSGLSLALEDADIALEHHSSFGGNYTLSAKGLVKTVLKGRLLSAGVKLRTGANFDYGGLASTRGELSAENISYGAITLESLKTDWNLFNLRRPVADKNYCATLTAEKLFIPARENSMRDGVSKSLALFSAAMGRPVPKIEDIEMSSLKAAFKLDNSAIAFSDLALCTNFMDLNAGLSIDGPGRTAEASLDAAIGANKIRLSASGPMASPRILPALSATLSASFRRSLLALENRLLETFPVTGE